MRRETVRQALVFGLLLLAGVGVRLSFRDLPNFAPIAALALFAGFYFRSSAAAVALPLAVMIISDQWLGGYHWLVMAAVYGTLAAPVALRSLVRRKLDAASEGRQAMPAALTVFGCSLAGSLAFFGVTNLAAWMAMDMYAANWQGLCECYLQALPFFRYTLAGDLTFATVLFGGYVLLQQSVFAGSLARPLARPLEVG